MRSLWILTCMETWLQKNICNFVRELWRGRTRNFTLYVTSIFGALWWNGWKDSNKDHRATKKFENAVYQWKKRLLCNSAISKAFLWHFPLNLIIIRWVCVAHNRCLSAANPFYNIFQLRQINSGDLVKVHLCNRNLDALPLELVSNQSTNKCILYCSEYF